MRRSRSGVVVVVSAALLGSVALTGCGGDAGAMAPATTPATAGQQAPAAPSAAAPKSGLGSLVVVPAGYLDDSREFTGTFGLESFVNNLSAVPAEDRALLLNADLAEGYQAARVSPDRKKRFTVQLFKTGSQKKANDLRQGFWNQETHSKQFAVPGVPGALSDARTVPTGVGAQSEAVAQVSFVVGNVVAEITIRQTFQVGETLAPDTGLATKIAKQQRAQLTKPSG